MALLIVNFGGPRHLKEVQPFLEELLTDQDVVRTGLPPFIHNPLFRCIARKRAKRVAKDYDLIGGKSPIYGDTEALAHLLRTKIDGPIITFHRYLPATHTAFISAMHTCQAEEITVFPLFPQFTHATTGSVARWMSDNLPASIVAKMHWIKSYGTHPAFVRAYRAAITQEMAARGLDDCFLLFSAHGIPRSFQKVGDYYRDECVASFNAVMAGFPKCAGTLSFQSKFGPGEWLRPYTSEMVEMVSTKGRKDLLVVPISFTSDHVETLFEVETDYLPPLRKRGLNAHRVPALTLRADWLDAIPKIINDAHLVPTKELIRSAR